MLLVEPVFRHVLLVEDFEVLHAGRNRVLFIFNSNSERVRFRVATEVAAEKLIVQPIRWVHRVSIVYSEKAAALFDEIPNGLLLVIGHPCGLRFSVTIRPVATVP